MAREALRLAPEALPACSCKFSRPDFTQNPLFALLARKTFFRTDSRGLLRRGEDFAALRRDLGLDKVPPSSTRGYATQRLLHKGTASGSSSRPPRAPSKAA